ncbi:HD domain-containing protein [bacterium]|nr:HD domain-containing protein [bacterium]
MRHIKDSNFEDDPLRILRAFRFKAITGFGFSEELKSAIKKYSSLVLKPSPERINYELMKLFGGEYTSDTLYLMDEYQILDILFPFVKELKKIPPNTHHHLDLFHHSIETVRNIQDQYLQSDVIKKHLDKIDFGGFERINHLKLAGFMHDIGKFSTWTIEEDTGRHRFIKHDDIGAKLSIGFLKNLKFSKKQIGYISEMIKFHIYPSSVVSASELTEKIMMRYLRKMGENVIDNIILAKSDRLSAQGEAITEEILNNNLNSLNSLLTFYLEKKDTLKPLPKLLDGFEIMQILNLTPSPRLGEIIDELKEAQINGDVITKDDAVNFIKEYKFKN